MHTHTRDKARDTDRASERNRQCAFPREESRSTLRGNPGAMKESSKSSTGARERERERDRSAAARNHAGDTADEEFRDQPKEAALDRGRRRRIVAARREIPI